MASRPDLSDLIKSYDVRGIVGDNLTGDVMRAIAAAFADTVVLPEGHRAVVVGRDMRDSGKELAAAFVAGLGDRGVDAVVIGMCSTDGLYHASGVLEMPGAMITASHNPAAYNGIKLCRSLARAVGENSGLAQVRRVAEGYLAEGVPVEPRRGGVQTRQMLPEYAGFLRSLVDLSFIRPLTVVVDAGNAMAGLTAPAVLGTAAGLPRLPVTVIPLYFELDGSFPNHEPNPLDFDNLRDLQAAVVKYGADLGVAFDGDADRCFVVDERGEIVSPSAITTLVGMREIEYEWVQGRRATIIHNVITSRAVPELLQRAGAVTVRTKVGHSNIKADMAAHNAVFGGEHSAHFYFRDFWYADSGMLAAMHVMAALGEQQKPLSDLAAWFSPYQASGEINSRVADVPQAIARVKAAFESLPVEIDELDGLTVTHWNHQPRWWFNVRGSNTEPLVRVNVEAAQAEVMAQIRDQVLALVRSEGA